ncbi:MAG: gamma-glutamylcyclotransferase family protein [Campylobacterota bacterium]|nr:gamma-glutamylcyclotransferase family protein [Campylobacterota bacterium]
MRTFIIGYGSLLKKTSLNRTLPQVEAIEPIYLSDYLRSWNAVENIKPTLSSTFLGIEKSEGSRVSCIIFEVEDSLLSTLDKREFLYNREKVANGDIEFTSNRFNIKEGDSVWIYITKEPSYPSSKYPIIQSYVDVCISGALEIEEEFHLDNFAVDFIKTTHHWSESWVNDRIFPRAPHIHQPDAYLIDILLSKNLNKFFTKITVE